MALQMIALLFLIGAIVLGFVKKINVGIVSLGLAFVLALIGGVKTSVIFAGFPGKLFVTLLGTMFFFCLLQENKTLELLSQKIVALVGKKTFLIPIIMYFVSYGLSAAGPGAISVQSVMIIFAVSLAVQMGTSPILMAALAILGAVGGTTSPIALSGIMSWFSSANGVVLPTLIPTVQDIVNHVGGNTSVIEMIMAIVGGATVAGISPLSTGGSLILASFTQETNASEKEQQSLFAKLFALSFAAVVVVCVFALLGGFKIFC